MMNELFSDHMASSTPLYPKNNRLNQPQQHCFQYLSDSNCQLRRKTDHVVTRSSSHHTRKTNNPSHRVFGSYSEMEHDDDTIHSTTFSNDEKNNSSLTSSSSNESSRSNSYCDESSVKSNNKIMTTNFTSIIKHAPFPMPDKLTNAISSSKNAVMSRLGKECHEEPTSGKRNVRVFLKAATSSSAKKDGSAHYDRQGDGVSSDGCVIINQKFNQISLIEFDDCEKRRTKRVASSSNHKETSDSNDSSDVEDSNNDDGANNNNVRQPSTLLSKSFDFDGILTNKDCQEDVARATLVDPIISVLTKSCNSTLLSFGGVNLGKTHTMVGSDLSAPEAGLIPTAISWIFGAVSHLLKFNGTRRIHVKVSAMEIKSSTDEIIDLLNTSNELHASEDLSEMIVSSSVDAAHFLDVALSNRCNDTPGKHSHFLFAIHIYNDFKKASLNFLDLGGCEKIRSAVSVRGSITLTSLGNCIIRALRRAKVDHGDRKVNEDHTRKIIDKLLSRNEKSKLLTEVQGLCCATVIAHVSTDVKSRAQTSCTLQIASKLFRMKRKRHRTSFSSGGWSSSRRGASIDENFDNGYLTTSTTTGYSSSDVSCYGVNLKDQRRFRGKQKASVTSDGNATDASEYIPTFMPSLNLSRYLNINEQQSGGLKFNDLTNVPMNRHRVNALNGKPSKMFANNSSRSGRSINQTAKFQLPSFSFQNSPSVRSQQPTLPVIQEVSNDYTAKMPLNGIVPVPIRSRSTTHKPNRNATCSILPELRYSVNGVSSSKSEHILGQYKGGGSSSVERTGTTNDRVLTQFKSSLINNKNNNQFNVNESFNCSNILANYPHNIDDGSRKTELTSFKQQPMSSVTLPDFSDVLKLNSPKPSSSSSSHLIVDSKYSTDKTDFCDGYPMKCFKTDDSHESSPRVVCDDFFTRCSDGDKAKSSTFGLARRMMNLFVSKRKKKNNKQVKSELFSDNCDEFIGEKVDWTYSKFQSSTLTRKNGQKKDSGKHRPQEHFATQWWKCGVDGDSGSLVPVTNMDYPHLCNETLSAVSAESSRKSSSGYDSSLQGESSMESTSLSSHMQSHFDTTKHSNGRFKKDDENRSFAKFKASNHPYPSPIAYSSSMMMQPSLMSSSLSPRSLVESTSASFVSTMDKTHAQPSPLPQSTNGRQVLLSTFQIMSTHEDYNN